MPFHVGPHKPQAVKHFKYDRKSRLPLLGFGALLIFGGLFQLAHGVLVAINWRAQLVYPGAMVATGAVAFVIGLIPAPWIEKAVKRLAALNPYSFAI
jgi:hypothetical protein